MFWDLRSLAAGATALLDVTATGARGGDLAQASLVTSSRFFEPDATTWSNTRAGAQRVEHPHGARCSDDVLD